MPFLKNLPTIEFGRKSRTIAFILLPVLAVALFSFFQTRKQLIAHVYEERSTLASLSAHVLKEKLDHLSDIGLSLATRPIFCQFVEEKKWDAAIGLMKEVPRDFPYINQLIIADTSGTIMTDALAIDGAKNTNQANRDWYKGIRENWQPYLSAVYQSPGKPSPVYCAFATPVKDTRGNVSAILVLQISPEKLLSWSNDVSVGKSGFVYIVDQKGHIAANPDYASQDSVIDYSSVPAVQKALKGEKNVEILYNPIAKENRLSAYEQVPGYGWAIIVQQRAAIALSVNDSLFPIITFYSVIILMAILFAWLVIRAMVQRENTEEALSQYREMVENTHVVIRNMQDEIIFWNKGMEKLYGWNRKEAIGQVTHKLFDTKFPRPLVEIEYDLLKNNQWQGELVHTRKDGAILNVSSHWSVHRDKHGNPIAIIETNNDITGLKEAEEQVRKSEENIHSLIDNVKDYAIFQLDKDGRVASWNAGAEHIKGYKEEEIIGQPMEIFYTPEDIEKGIPQRNLQMAKEKGHHEDEGWRIRKDGSRFLADIVFTALHDCNGDLRGFAKVTRDITERKKAEEQVEFLSWQISKSHDSIYILDAGNKIVNWNVGAENLYEFTKEEALGKDPNELLNTDMSKSAIAIALREISENNYWTGELKRKTKTGKDICVHSSTTNIKNDQGQIIGYVAVSFDITEQKKLREEVKHLASLVEQSSEAILSVDLDLRILTWNKGAEHLHGYKEEEVLGKTSYELGIIHFTDEEMAAMRKRLIEQGGFRFEANLSRKDGSSFYGSVSVDTLKNEHGEISGIFFIAKDISERRQLEEQLKMHSEELEEKVKERTEEVYKNEKKYRYLFENNPMPMFVMDLETLRFLDVNEIAVIKYGYSRDELLSMTALDIRPEEDQEMFKQLDFSFKPQRADYDKGTWRYKKKNGSIVYVEVIAHEIMFGDRPARLVLSNDITEKKEAEEKLATSEKRFRALLENNNDVISLFDEKFNIIYRSPSAHRVTGWSNEETVQRPAISNIHPDYKEMASNELREVLANPGKSLDTSFRYRHKDGHYFWVEGTVANFLHDENIKAIVLNFRDVTEKKEAEEKLEFSEKRFRALIENSVDVITVFDPHTHEVIYNSPSAIHVTGWGAQEFNLFTEPDNIHPDDRNKINQITKEAIYNPGEALYVLFRAKHKNGYYLWLEASITNKSEEEGIGGILMNYRDVTTRIESEKRLASSEKRFRALIENNYDMISLFDESFNIIYRSPSTERGTGWKTEEMIGVDGTKYVHPDDQVKAGEIIYDLMANPGKSRNTLTRYLHKNGHYLWLEGVITNLLHDEDVKAIVFNYRDVSERMVAEEKIASSELRFRSLIENSAEGISLLDEHSNVIYRSPSAYKVIGDNPKENSISLAHPDDLETFKNKFAESLSNPGKAVPYHVRYYNASGHYIWAEGIFTNLLHVKGVNAVVANYRDVTDRVEAQEKIASSELLFRSVIEHSAEGITMTDASMNTFYISPSASKIVGEHLVFDLRKSTHPGDIESSKRARQESLEHPGQPVPFKGRYLNPLGGYSWLEGTLTNLLDLKGVEAIVSNFRDVTEQKKAEEKLATSELRFRALIEHSAEGISLTDEASNTVYRSPSAIRILGNASLINLRNYAHPRDLKELQKVREESLRKPGVPISFHGRFLHPHGHHYWMEGSLTNMLHVKGVEAIVANFRDITEKKEAEDRLASSERRFRSLIENSSDAIVMNDGNYNILYQSPSVEKILGYKASDRLGKQTIDYVHPDSRKEYIAFYKKLRQSSGIPMPFQYQYIHKNGNYVWLEGVVTNHLKDPEINAFVANYRDITDRKKAEEQLRESEKLYRNLFENMLNGFAYCKAIFKRGRLKDYTYVHVNNEIEEITGLKNITGKNMSEVIPGLLDSDPGLADVITRVILSGKPEKFETYIKPLERWYAVSLYSPAKGYFVTLADNISERKRAEEELHKSFVEKQMLAERMSSILNTLPANIALVDDKGFIIEVNDEWKKFADENDYSGSKYCIGDNYIKIAAEATGEDKTDGKKVARGIEAVLANEINEFVYEYPCNTPKIKRWFRMIVTPLKEKAYTGAVVMHIDISELRRLEKERMHSKELEQRKITRAMLSAQERERNSIAQELHDNVNQILAGTNLFLSIAKRNPEKSLEHIETSMESISAAIEENRKLAHELVTPDFETIKLEDLLHSLTDQMLKLPGIDTHIHLGDFQENQLKDEQKLAIYRIAQEQCSNIVKYAQASMVNISLDITEGIFTMRIADNGKGMEPVKVVNGIGLKNIKSRLTILNGGAKIITAPGKGFALEVRMPCAK